MKSEITFALDRGSIRRVDQDNHLHVTMTNLSKANVCPYYGREIPNYQALGLDARKVYMLLRDPQELAKAAESFRGKPLLDQHVPAFADDHPTDRVVGAVGNDVTFDGQFLKGSLSVWTEDAIERIENGEQRELSCGYRYVADMTPGTQDGVAFDGVMREIQGNHVALVDKGRAGSDVLVGDSRLEMSKMITSRKALVASGAIFATVRPLLAADSALKFDDAFAGVDGANFTHKREEIADAVMELVKPHLAADKELDRDAVLIALDAADDTDDDDMANDELTAEEIAAAKKARKKKPMAGDRRPSPAPRADPVIAVDADAIRADVMGEVRAIRIAEDATLPHLGELAIRPETPNGYYKLALDAAVADGRIPKLALDSAKPEAYASMVAILPLPGGDAPEPKIAMDERTTAKTWMDDLKAGKF